MPLCVFCFYARNTCRQEISKRKFNVMLAISGGHLLPVLLLPLMFLWNRSTPEKALATSVLYLVRSSIGECCYRFNRRIRRYCYCKEVLFGISFIVYCCRNGFEVF